MVSFLKSKEVVLNNLTNAVIQLNGGKEIFTEYGLNDALIEVAAIIKACPDEIFSKALEELRKNA